MIFVLKLGKSQVDVFFVVRFFASEVKNDLASYIENAAVSEFDPKLKIPTLGTFFIQVNKQLLFVIL